jgi:hypothetical protein
VRIFWTAFFITDHGVGPVIQQQDMVLMVYTGMSNTLELIDVEMLVFSSGLR